MINPKVRFKKEGSPVWGEYSEPVAYFTAGKPFSISVKKAKKSIKANRSIKWKKKKGIKKYIVVFGYSYMQYGYNIFGVRVSELISDTESEIIKGNFVNLKKKFKPSSDEVKGMECVHVYPVAKHGKFYYVSGIDYSKKIRSWDIDELYD